MANTAPIHLSLVLTFAHCPPVSSLAGGSIHSLKFTHSDGDVTLYVTALQSRPTPSFLCGAGPGPPFESGIAFKRLVPLTTASHFVVVEGWWAARGTDKVPDPHLPFRTRALRYCPSGHGPYECDITSNGESDGTDVPSDPPAGHTTLDLGDKAEPSLTNKGYKVVIFENNRSVRT